MAARPTFLLPILALLTAPAIAPPASAQTVRTLVLQGDSYFGAGSVVSIENMRVNNDGDWVVHVTTDATPAYMGDVFIRNGLVTLQGGDPLAAPTGATVGALGDFSFNGDADLGTIITLHDWDSSRDTGAYFNSVPIGQESSTTSAPEFSPGTTWISFEEVRINDSRQMLIIGELNDSSIPGVKDWGLVIAEYDEEGNVLSERAMLWETGTIPGPGVRVEKFGFDFRSLAFTDTGEFLVYIDSDATASQDGILYRSTGTDYSVVAREGRNSPIQSRNWNSLYSKSLTLNDYGEYAFTGTILGDSETDQLLVLNGEKYAQEGDFLPAIAPYKIMSFLNAPIHLSNSGDLFWFASFDETHFYKNTAIFRNREMIVQEGVTPAHGLNIRGIRISGNSYFISPNGRYLVFEADLSDFREGAFLMDLGLVERMSGCYGNDATLELDSGLPLLGHTLEFALDHGQGPGVTPLLLVSTLPIAGWPDCGIDLPFGELLVDVSSSNGNPAVLQVGLPWYGLPTKMSLEIPEDLGLLGVDAYVQGLFWDVGDQLPEQNFLLAGAKHIQIAAP